jgi:glycerol-3-phosphate acyltransferase PlsY
MAAAVSVPVIFMVLERGGWYAAFGAILAALVVYKHRANIARLLQGKEFRVGFRRNKA